MKNQKKILNTIGGLAALAAATMFAVGSSSPNLTELLGFSPIPLVLAVVCFLVAAQSKE